MALVSRGVGYPALRQAPYVALVLGENYVWLDPSRRVRRQPKVEILGNVQFIGRLCRNFGRKSRPLVSGPGIGVMSGIPKDSSRVLGKFGAGPFSRQKVSAFSKWARHRGDVRNSKGFVSGLGKFGAALLQPHTHTIAFEKLPPHMGMWGRMCKIILVYLHNTHRIASEKLSVDFFKLFGPTLAKMVGPTKDDIDCYHQPLSKVAFQSTNK
ncbi:Putative disease resistance TIR-NBS-LRR class protein [Prunus dulcis]|uniref:Disease resistance TIR-NBS-LRR class protein n=1 Tax=Prunus dulcis TaxID=3755 RepID=A0A5H2XRR8_PRUDU|nr:Putative disease resistance TIR-NBS-LRR class protein [Prunus dulcis]